MVPAGINRHTDLADLDTVGTIRLHEAVTWLAFGESHTAAVERSRQSSENNALQEQIENCLEAASRNLAYCHFPRLLPLSPLGALIKQIENSAQPLPPSTLSLLQMANEVMRVRNDRDDRYAIALHRILEGARSGKLEMFGRQSSAVSGPVLQIPLSFLRSDSITVDWSYENLGHVRNTERPTRRRAIIAPDGDLSVAYYKVEMDRRAFLLLFKVGHGHGQAVSTSASSLTDADLTRWYVEDYVPGLVATQTVTTEKEDVDAAKSLFPKVVKLRRLIADLRRDKRPDAIRRFRGRPGK
jgi:hypothetical protein